MNENEVILKAMKKAGKPLKGGEIAELTGFDKKIVDKSIKTLQKEGKVISPIRCFYQAK